MDNVPRCPDQGCRERIENEMRSKVNRAEVIKWFSLAATVIIVALGAQYNISQNNLDVARQDTQQIGEKLDGISDSISNLSSELARISATAEERNLQSGRRFDRLDRQNEIHEQRLDDMGPGYGARP